MIGKIHFGDCRESLRAMAAAGVRVQTCVTSPPYYNLRDYQVDGQLGQEKTPEAYVSNLVEVFRAVRDVLADDGTLWLNLGNSYGKGKQLLGIPWRVAFALQDDGWVLRQELIWHKPNPTPESVKDRCTNAHEQIFLLSKGQRYFFDAIALQERAADGLTRNRRSVWTVPVRAYKGAHSAVFPPALVEPCILAGSLRTGAFEPDDIIATPAGKGERLSDPSMRTGRAGMNRPRREMEAVRPMSRQEQIGYAGQLRASSHRAQMVAESGGETTFAHYIRTDASGARPVPAALLGTWISRGWICCVDAAPRPAAPHRSIVLDPFMGSGTTAAVAIEHGRKFIGCELNQEYKPLQDARIAAANNARKSIPTDAANDSQIDLFATKET